MRAQEFLSELFQPGKDWKWSFRGSEEAVAVFHVGKIPYMFHAYGADGDWEAEFKQHGSKLNRLQKFGLTGTGNSAEVMSTVVDIMRSFLEKYKDKIQVLTFSAKEDSRQGLYARMVKRLLPDWTMKQSGEHFVLVAPETVTEDWGIETYPIPLPIGDYLSHEDHEFAPPGNYQDVFVLHDEVGDLIDAGVEPYIVPVDPKQLLATQDWLSNDGGGEPLFPEYPDRPVVYEKNGKYYILDGHHRTTKAWKTGRPISVYLFTDQPDNELDESKSFNRCFDRACQLYDRAEAKGIEATLLQVADYQGDGSAADPRWQKLPQYVWKHYVTVIGDTVYDPTAKQFGPDKLEQYNLGQLESDWKEIYQIRSTKMNENFADGRNPQDKGDSKRHGVPTKASVSTLRKVAKQGGRKGQLAHWMANMKAGRAKAKRK